MKFLVTADLHLGSHGVLKEDISFEVLAWIYSVAKQEKVDFITIAGDIFKSSNPKDSVKNFLIDFLINGEGSEINTRYLVGNHDFYLKSGYDYKNNTTSVSSVDIYQKIKMLKKDNFKVISSPQFEVINNTNFLFYPYGVPYKNLNMKIKQDISEFDNSILIGHFPITKTKYDNNVVSKSGVDIYLLDNKNVFGYFGHFHNHQRFFNSMYCGSPYQQKSNEFGEKGIWIITTKNGIVVNEEFVENTFSPLFVRVVVNLIDETIKVYNSDLIQEGGSVKNLKELFDIVDGNVVKLDIISDSLSNYEDFYNKNKMMFLRFIDLSYSYSGSIHVKSSAVSSLNDLNVLDTQTKFVSFFVDYLKEKKYSDEDELIKKSIGVFEKVGL